MMFMNEYEIKNASFVWCTHPILGPATQTLMNLMDWTNSNSDGWPYWQKPCRAASKLMELLQGDGSPFYSYELPSNITEREYKQALKPIKSFRTRFNADFEIVEV